MRSRRSGGSSSGEPFALSRYSFVAPAGDAVLKVTPPEDDESDEEADALELWAGDGEVRLLRHDRARRALLVERVWWGHLSALPDEEATSDRVSRPGSSSGEKAAEPFRWIGDHVPRWLDNAGANDLAALARDLYASLDVGRTTLVHGDFHHHNILWSTRGAVAIYLKPMLGEPEYDVPSFLWNPLWASDEPRRDRAATRRPLPRLGSTRSGCVCGR